MSRTVVDPEGVKRTVRERGEVTLLDELVQNALDTVVHGTTEITVEISSPGTNRVQVVVTDNSPLGYSDLSQALVWFAESEKRNDSGLRGFMNVGDKLCVEYCTEGLIRSTTGSILIEGDRAVQSGRRKTDVGTIVDMTFPVSKAVMAEMLQRARQYLIPEAVEVYVNGELLPTSAPAQSTSAKLRVYRGTDVDGMNVMREVTKNVELHLYEPDGRGAWIYVLGIPVQRAEELPFTVDVRDRLKAEVKRDQVPPQAFHRIKVALADVLADKLTQEDFSTWARPQIVEEASDDVVRHMVVSTYGADAMIENPFDKSANTRAYEEGRTVIPRAGLTPTVRDRVKTINTVDPSFAPTTSSEYGTTTGEALGLAIPEAQWSPRAREVVAYARRLFEYLFPGHGLSVSLHDGVAAADCVACMGHGGRTGHLSINRDWDWFNDRQEVLDTLIHEFAHYAAPDKEHQKAWGEACAAIGASVALWGQLP